LQVQVRLLLVDLLQGLEQAPLQPQERVLLQGLVQAQVRGLLRQQERQPLRCEGRVLLRAQMQHREQVLLRLDERAQARGPVMRPERGHERPLRPPPYRRLLRVPEQGPFRGQGLPQLSGGRAHRGKSKCKMQSAKWRNRR
jgi:hypothetical protein